MGAVDLNDAELVTQTRQGQKQAYAQIVERHGPRIYRMLLRLVSSEADAAELTQDVFLLAFQHLSEVNSEASFASWLNRIAANAGLMRLRQRRREPVADVDIGDLQFSERGSLLETVADGNVETLAMNAELGAAIQSAVDRLPDDHRTVFVLRDLEGLHYDEIAEITGDSVPAIKSRLHRARLHLRREIDQFLTGGEISG